MSTVEDTPCPGIDGWVERTSMVGRLESRWLERTLDVATDHVEHYYGDYQRDVAATRTAHTSARTTRAPLVRPTPAPTASSPPPTVTLCTAASRLLVTLNPRAVRALYDEIRAQSHAIETRGLETGGGLFGPPIRGWHERAHVAIANVAVASRGRSKVELAYGQIEAKEADLIRFQDSPLRRLGDWHATPPVLPAASGSRQRPTCRSGSLNSTGSTAADPPPAMSGSSPQPANAAGRPTRSSTAGWLDVTSATDRSANPQRSPWVARTTQRDELPPRRKREP